MRKLLLFGFFLALLLPYQMYAQGRTVTGKVTSAVDKSSMPGVNVSVKGTAIGTITNGNGEYSISVPGDDAILVFSFVGSTTEEVRVGSQSSISISLVDDIKQLSEVVVIGYGSQEKKNITGAVSSVNGDALKNLPVQSFDQALAGRATGVNVTTPNGVLGQAPVIRIRGTNSISSGSSPLIVVDGMPVRSGDVSTSGLTANNSLGGVNPADIESIEVLKDASAAAIFGSRASNGVVLITTKKGKKGGSKFTYDTWVGQTNAFNLLPVLDAQQYMDMKNEALRNNNQQPGYFPSFNPDGSLVDTDWYSELYRTGKSHNHDMSISGGSDKTVYRFSLGYTDQSGFVRNNNFRRLAGSMNVNHKVTNWFNVGSTLTLTNSLTQSPNVASTGAFASGGLGRHAVALPPNVAPKLADGSYNIIANRIGDMANKQPSTWWNPIVDLEKSRSTSESNRIVGNVFGEIVALKAIKIRSQFGVDEIRTEDLDFRTRIHGEGFADKGRAANSTAKFSIWNWQNTASYSKSFGGKHNLDVLAGYEAQVSKINGWGAARTDISDDFFTTYQGGFGQIAPLALNQTQNGLVSYLGRIMYDMEGKYLVTFNARRDGLSALAVGNKWGDFYGGSVGWRVSQENFFRNTEALGFVSDLKLRASLGQLGNTNIPNFGSLNFYSSGLYGGNPTWFMSQVGNPLLQWESSTKTDLGIDAGFFNDRLTASFSYYNTLNDNLILNNPQAPSKGIPGNVIVTNVGSMVNSGIELSLSSQNINKNGFTWNTTFNITTNNNKILALNETGDDIFQATGGLENVSIARVGEALGSLYAVRTAGVNPANGRRIFINKNGEQVQYDHSTPQAAARWTYLDGRQAPAVTAADRVIVGNTNPRWFGGLDNNFTYKNFDFGIMLQYVGGNYVYNGMRAGMLDQRNWNNSTAVLNRWTESGQNTDIPRVVWGDNVSNGSAFPLDVNVERGDFIRVRNIQLGYSFNEIGFVKSLGVSSLRLYGQVQNAGILTKYRGFDPENSINGDVNIATGVDRNSVPQARTINFGLNLGF